MATMLDSMLQNVMGNVPGSAENQSKLQNQQVIQNSQIANQALSFKLAQDKLKASATAQLAPLQMEADKLKLQDEIGKAKLEMFMQPYQRKELENTYKDSLTTGSDPKTGMTGEPDIDLQIAEIDKRVKREVILKPGSAATAYENGARAKKALRDEYQTRKDDKTNSIIQQVGSMPRASLLSIASQKPDDPMYAFINKAVSKNPNITDEALQSQLSRVFGMDAKERELRDYTDRNLADQQRYHKQSYDEKIREYDTTAERKKSEDEDRFVSQRMRSEETQLGRDKLNYEKQKDRDIKLEAHSNTTVTKALQDYKKLNTDYRPRGTGSELNSIRTVESITGGKPVNAASLFESMSKDASPDGKIDANQIRALTVMKSELTKFFPATGQGSIKDILAHQRAAGLLPGVGSKIEAYLFGVGNVELANKNERMKFAESLSDMYDTMVKKTAGAQIENANIALTDPDIKPSHKLRLAQNMFEDPNSLRPTKVNAGKKMLEDLSRRGIDASPVDHAAAIEAIKKIQDPKLTDEERKNPPAVPMEERLAQNVLLKLYNKYTKGLEPSTQPQANTSHKTEDQLRAEYRRNKRLGSEDMPENTSHLYDYSPKTMQSLDEEFGFPKGLASRVMKVESGGNTAAVSNKGAVGPMQVEPSTARDPGYGIKPFDPYDPKGAMRYLAALRDGPAHGDIKKAIAMYNAGAKGNLRNKETRNYSKQFADVTGE